MSKFKVIEIQYALHHKLTSPLISFKLIRKTVLNIGEFSCLLYYWYYYSCLPSLKIHSSLRGKKLLYLLLYIYIINNNIQKLKKKIKKYMFSNYDFSNSNFFYQKEFLIFFCKFFFQIFLKFENSLWSIF